MIKHKKISLIPDSPDTSLVNASDWNDDHSIESLELDDLKVGGISDGDYSEFEADGGVEFHGAAMRYEDLIGTALQFKVLGTGVSINSAENTLVFTATADLSDYGYDNFQIRHGWDQTEIYPHVHWEQAQNNIPNWLLQYRWQTGGEQKITAWTNHALDTNLHTYTSGTLNQMTYGAPIPAPANVGLSDILEIRIVRDNANASGVFVGANTYTASAGVTSIDFHIKENTTGSRQEFVK